MDGEGMLLEGGMEDWDGGWRMEDDAGIVLYGGMGLG